MFTTCNECGTVFRVSSAELRAAEGQVRCGHCSATFNAVATLTDELPPTTILPQLTIPAHLERQPAAAAEPDPEPAPAIEAEPVLEPEPDISALDTITGDETLEFNVPEDNWSDFFVEPAEPQPPPQPLPEPLPELVGRAAPEADLVIEGDAEADEVDEAHVYRIDTDSTDTAAGSEPEPDTIPVLVPASPAQDIEAEEADGATAVIIESANPPDGDPEPPVEPVLSGRPFEWRPEFEPPAATPRGRRFFGLGATMLAIALVLQLIHYQRDELAAHPALHGPLTRAYAALNLSLLPDWNLNAYEVRSSEAVAGATSRGALDVLARIAIVGTEPVGLPLVRVILHDRFAKSLGSRVFTPDEYLDDVPLPAGLLAPGYLIPVRISLRDPGTEAFGYEVDVCVLYRQGLVCQQERDQKVPFTR
jgi:predicted Zn finger-like uncharacterized protein